MYITEIKESDFRNLDLVGYNHIKIELDNSCHKWGYTKVKLNEVIDKELSYGSSMKTIAIFMVDAPEEGDKFDSEMFDKIPFDKYYWRDGNSYQIWNDVNKIYSKKNYWFIDSNAEFGRLKKSGIDRIYLIHLGE